MIHAPGVLDVSITVGCSISPPVLPWGAAPHSRCRLLGAPSFPGCRQPTHRRRHNWRAGCACVRGELIREADPGIHYPPPPKPKWKQTQTLFVNKDASSVGLNWNQSSAFLTILAKASPGGPDLTFLRARCRRWLQPPLPKPSHVLGTLQLWEILPASSGFSCGANRPRRRRYGPRPSGELRLGATFPPDLGHVCSLAVRPRAPTPRAPETSPCGAEVMMRGQRYCVFPAPLGILMSPVGLGSPFLSLHSVPCRRPQAPGPPPAPTSPLHREAPRPAWHPHSLGHSAGPHVRPFSAGHREAPRKAAIPSPCLPSRPSPHSRVPVPTLFPFLRGGSQAPARHSKLFTILLILTSDSCFPVLWELPSSAHTIRLTVRFPWHPQGQRAWAFTALESPMVSKSRLLFLKVFLPPPASESFWRLGRKADGSPGPLDSELLGTGSWFLSQLPWW